MKFFALLILFFCSVKGVSQAQESKKNQTDNTTTAKKNSVSSSPSKFSSSYFIMQQNFKGVDTGAKIAPSPIPQFIPTKLQVYTSSLSLRYNPTENLNIELVGQYLDNSIDLLMISNRGTVNMPVSRGGLSDTLLGANYRVMPMPRGNGSA